MKADEDGKREQQHLRLIQGRLKMAEKVEEVGLNGRQDLTVEY